MPGFVQLTANLSGVERGMLAQCEGHKGDQKNWMALEYKGALYALSRIHPLEVVRLDWEAGCSVVQRDPGGGEAALQAVRRDWGCGAAAVYDNLFATGWCIWVGAAATWGPQRSALRKH